MKAIIVILLAFLFTPQDPGGVEVLKFNWSKERIGWERDPFGGPIVRIDYEDGTSWQLP